MKNITVFKFPKHTTNVSVRIDAYSIGNSDGYGSNVFELDCPVIVPEGYQLIITTRSATVEKEPPPCLADGDKLRKKLKGMK